MQNRRNSITSNARGWVVGVGVWGVCYFSIALINTWKLGQDGCLFTDDIFKCISLDESTWILIKISLKFVPKGPINNIPALVQKRARHRPGA